MTSDSLFPSSLCPGAEEAGFPLTTGTQKTHFSFPHTPPVTLLSLPLLDMELLETAQECIFPPPHPTWKIPRGCGFLGTMSTPILAADWLGSPHPLLPLVLPLCHPLGAGSSAGDVPSNPTVRGKEGGNFTFPYSRFTLTLNAFEFLVFLRKIYIYLGFLGGKGNFFFPL